MNAVSDLSKRVRAWARRHSYSFFSSLGSLLNNRVGTLMTVLVLGIAILLPMGLYVTLANLDRLDLAEEEWGALTVFMSAEADEVAAQKIGESLGARDDVARVELISPEEGMQEFQAASGFGDAIELLETNPLPWVISVTPAAQGTRAMQERVQELTAWLEGREGVVSIAYDYKWLQRLGRLLELGRAAVTVLTILFAVAVIVVIANTIRLDVAARAEEIEVLALVGANNGFIRQPFLYAGFWYGLLGGIVATVLINGALVYLHGPIARLLDSYGQPVDLIGLDGKQTLLLLGCSGALGMGGAWISVQRYLRRLRIGGTLGRR